MRPTVLGLSRPLLVIGWIAGAGLAATAAADGDEATLAASASKQAPPSVDAAGPATSYGVFYERHEPTFYTGFAPRTLDPERIQLHVGRGNQLRVTVVLSDEVLDSYADDLLARYRTLRSLIDTGEVQPTQNTSFEVLEATQRSLPLDGMVAAEKGMAEPAVRERNLALMERLNPGRVFRIRMPIDEVVARWMAAANGVDPQHMDAERELELLNAMLPTRLFLDKNRLDAPTSAELKSLVAEAGRRSASPRAEAVAALRPSFQKLFERVTRGHYPVRGEALEFAEFTAIYPVGTANEFVPYNGRQIPLYPTPGRWRLMTHQRSNTIDHIAPWASYSYSPWLPYMHVGTNMHNAFHTPYWALDLTRAAFLPDTLRSTTAKSRDGGPFQFAYLLSRGPASHGCTHVNPGHLVELRQLLPSETERLHDVEVFINKSHLFDVFDIDGDFQPEVMGVRYFIAYSIRDDKPGTMRAPIQRAPYYDWLYAGDLHLAADGSGFFNDVRDAKFAGDTAMDGATYGRIRLYEAAYEPERIQFYATRPIPFVRELRKVSAQHPFSEAQAKSERPL